MSHSLDTPNDPSTTADPSTADVAKGEARGVAQSTTGAAQQVAGTAADQAKEVAGEARRQATDLLSQGRDQASTQARAGQQKAAGSLTALADELRSLTDGDGGSGPATDLLRQATDRVDTLAGHLRDREPGDLLDEVRRFARRRPGAFLLGAAVAGVLAGRLTTGVVAAHKEDSPSSTPSSTASPAVPVPSATPGPTVPVTGGPGYDPVSGYTPVPPSPYGLPGGGQA